VDLDASAATVDLEIQPAPPYGGMVGRTVAAAFNLAGATVSANAKARAISVQGASLALDAQAAATFNEAFAERREVFRGGESLGSLSFVAQGQ
jgi:hypothetical protein